MEKTNIIKIGLVSYLNTLPFVYGIRTMIENQKQWNLKIIQAYPSECTNLFRENKIDIGIIPIGALPNLKNYQIVSKFCLGTKQKVDSVLLLSHNPIKNIDTILLDYQSETSVLMAKILARYYWKINPIWENTTQGFEDKIKNNTAGIVIGDRTFTLKNKFEFTYDLAYEWFSFQKLPFVFAAWVAKPNLSKQFINDFNLFLNIGVQQIPKALKLFFNNYNLPITQTDALDYLTNKMNYNYTKEMQKSKDKFLSFLKNLE